MATRAPRPVAARSSGTGRTGTGPTPAAGSGSACPAPARRRLVVMIPAASTASRSASIRASTAAASPGCSPVWARVRCSTVTSHSPCAPLPIDAGSTTSSNQCGALRAARVSGGRRGRPPGLPAPGRRCGSAATRWSGSRRSLRRYLPPGSRETASCAVQPEAGLPDDLTHERKLAPPAMPADTAADCRDNIAVGTRPLPGAVGRPVVDGQNLRRRRARGRRFTPEERRQPGHELSC
jgi:hypothetical protein